MNAQRCMKLLLVEDNPGDARLFREVVKEMEMPDVRFEVTCAEYLADARRCVGAESFDVAFLDLGLPDADGLEALHALREDAAQVPIIVLTGRERHTLGIEALQGGAQEYLTKGRLNGPLLEQTIRFAIERKQIEETVRERERQRLQAQKLEAIGQLAAGIAHEINTPMQFIGDNLSFLREGIEGLREPLLGLVRLVEAAGEVSGYLVREVCKSAAEADIGYLVTEIPDAVEQSLEGVKRVTKIVRAMKEFAHPGTDEKSMVDLRRAIESTVDMCRNEWKYVADVMIEVDPDLPPVWCYPGDLNQVVLNLIVNAAHAIGDALGGRQGEKGRITVAARRDGDRVEIRVTDTGTGIPDEVRDRVLEPFFTTKDVGKGTGQGLSVARGIVVDRHGGTIDFETELGKGTTFVVSLPLNETCEPAPAEQREGCEV